VRAWINAAVRALGRAAFLPSLALFPVAYLDGDRDGAGGTPELAVFTFPPLASNIGVRRRRRPAEAGAGDV
jgi:hypothetical protein